MKRNITLFILLMSGFISFALEESVDNFVLTGYDQENTKKWELYGKNAKVSAGQVILSSVLVKLYEKNGDLDIKARKGIIRNKDKLVSLQDNVVVKNSNGVHLYTQKLQWRQGKDKIWTEDFIRVVEAENEITGIGGEIDTNFNKAALKKNVTFKTIPQTIITSKGPLEVDYTKNIATFNKNVHVVDRRGELFCNKLIIYFDPEKKKITKARALGNVKLRRGNSWSFSQEAIYDIKKGSITLLGNPKLEIYPK